MVSETGTSTKGISYSFVLGSENIVHESYELILVGVDAPESNQSRYIKDFLDSQDSKNSKVEYNILIDSLINFNYQLKQPINVHIEYVDNEYFGTIEELEIYAYAESEAAVLREINIDLTSLFNILIDNPKYQLGKKPKTWKKILTKYISKKKDEL